MDTIHIDLAPAGCSKMSDAVVNRIEEALSVERAAFEYDSYPGQLNIVQKSGGNL